MRSTGVMLALLTTVATLGTTADADDCPTVVRAWYTDRSQVESVAAGPSRGRSTTTLGYLVVGVDATASNACWPRDSGSRSTNG